MDFMQSASARISLRYMRESGFDNGRWLLTRLIDLAGN